MAPPALDFDAESVLCRCCSREAGANREAEVPEIIIVSDAMEGTLVDLDGKSLQEEQKGRHPRKWELSKWADWTEMRKGEKRLKCTLLNGSAWSTEKKFLRRYKGTFDIFFGIEHRLRKEEMEEQLNKEAKEGSRFAASAARISEKTAGDEDRKHKSGGGLVAIVSRIAFFPEFTSGIRKDGRREMKHCWEQF